MYAVEGTSFRVFLAAVAVQFVPFFERFGAQREAAVVSDGFHLLDWLRQIGQTAVDSDVHVLLECLSRFGLEATVSYSTSISSFSDEQLLVLVKTVPIGVALVTNCARKLHVLLRLVRFAGMPEQLFAT